jgi:methyl-accepting chemotaxis protein
MLAIALGVVVLTALVTAGLARRTAANAARDDLAQHGPVVADEFDNLLSRFRTSRPAAQAVLPALTNQNVRDLIATTLQATDGALVGIGASGNVQEILSQLFGTTASVVQLPSGVRTGDLDVATLQAGRRQSGRVGDTVFLAIPLQPVRDIRPVVVLAQHVSRRPFGQSSGVVLGAAAFALVIAALVAAYLARRMTRPLAAMESTTTRIAGGDLSARVDLGAVPHDELGTLAHAINGMADKLQAAQHHERAFLLSVSHDLRTPLTSIRGYAEAISDGALVGEEARGRAAAVISSESRRLERLVADLLDLARLDAHEFSLTPRARRRRMRRSDAA